MENPTKNLWHKSLRWTEQGLDLGREKAFNFDFTSMDVASLTILGEIFGALGIGQVDQKGVVEVSPKGYVALQRVYSYYVPTSYAPLLSHFHHVLFEDASWGFNVEEDEDGEIHVDRTLNVVGSGAQHTSLFKDPSKPGFRGTMSSGDGWKMLEYSVPCGPCLDDSHASSASWFVKFFPLVWKVWTGMDDFQYTSVDNFQ